MNKVYTDTPLQGSTVLFAVVDQAKVKSRHAELFQRMFGITWFYTHRLADTIHADVKFFDNIDLALSGSEGYDLVLIQSVGNHIHDNDILGLLDQYITAHPDFFLVGFTLDWQGTDWLELHHQMILINRNVWADIGSPIYGNWETKTELLPNYSRSIENFHDHYTPYWIKGETGLSEMQRTKQGWNIIKTALLNEIKIDNFSQAMRDCRLYLYPESRSEDFYDCITNNTIDPTLNPNQVRWLKKKTFKPDIWIFNSERYQFDIPVCNIDTYMGPASGFKYLAILNESPNVDFVFYDFHPKSLEWIETMKKEWDGNNLIDYMARKSEFAPMFKYINNSLEENLSMMFDDFGSEDNFKQLWNRFRVSNAKFLQINLFSAVSAQSLLDRAVGKTFLYYSNIFSTDFTIRNYDLDYVRNKHEDFLSMATNVEDIVLRGTDYLNRWTTTTNSCI